MDIVLRSPVGIVSHGFRQRFRPPPAYRWRWRMPGPFTRERQQRIPADAVRVKWPLLSSTNKISRWRSPDAPNQQIRRYRSSHEDV